MLLRPVAETPTDIRRHNRFAVLSLLREHGTLTKSDLVALTARTGTTMSSILDILAAEGLVEVVDGEDDHRNGEISRGRPSTPYRLCGRRWLPGGIQVGSATRTA